MLSILFAYFYLIREMNTKFVFRVENKDLDVGFWFRSDGTESHLAEKLGTSNRTLPMPYDREKFTSPSGRRWICSAPTLEAMLHWFGKDDFPILIQNGFKFHMYEVSEYLEDGPQTLFTREGVISDTILPDDALYGVKQVIVVRKDLIKGSTAVRRGKMMAQACHASVGALMQYFEKDHCISLPNGLMKPGQEQMQFLARCTPGSPLNLWINGLFTKVVVSVENEKELLEVWSRVKADTPELPLPAALITDSGLTEFHGVPTLTCLGIGPWFSNRIDNITGNLPLL